MKIAGIIAEYDPFHNGHAWQITTARAQGAQCVMVCLSTAATQRGALPLLSEQVRIEAALRAGADLVLSMPAIYAASGAEQFARAGVAILAAAGCDTLVFGAETPEVAQLMGCAKALTSVEYQAAVRDALAQGARNFASARQQAVQSLYPNACYGAMLSNPNDNLAIEYCKAILQQNAPLTPYALPRIGANHGEQLAACEVQKINDNKNKSSVCYASGSALRKAWQTGGASALQGYVPEEAFALYQAAEQAGQHTNWDKVDIALLSRLRAAMPEGFDWVRGVSEGLEYRLADAVKKATTADGLYDALTTVRYPRARMRRLCLDAAMGVGKSPLPPLPPYLHLLGGRKQALGQLKNARLPVSASLSVLREENSDCKIVVDAQTVYSDFSALCMANSVQMGASYTKKIVIF